MKIFLRIAGRIALVAAAAAVCIGLTAAYTGTIPPLPPRRPLERRIGARRPPWPRWIGVGQFGAEAGLIAMITFGGRKLLRLRLSD